MKQKIANYILILFMGVFLQSYQNADSGLYKYVDKNGVVHFTDQLSQVPEEYQNQIKQTNPEQGPLDYKELVKKVKPAVVYIEIYDKEKQALGSCSGFFISSNGDVITNRHCLEDAYSGIIKTSDGKIYQIKQIVGVSQKGEDIIRISVDIPPSDKVKYLSFNPSLPEQGERILVIGNPLGLESTQFTASDGIVSGIRDSYTCTFSEEEDKRIQITAPVSHGSSGSPVVNLKGEVLGVAVSSIEEGQNLNFAVPSYHINKLQPVNKSLSELAGIISAEESCYDGLQYIYISISNGPNGKNYYEEAIKKFKSAIDSKPDYAEAYLLIGVCYYFLGNYKKAAEAYKNVIRINPELYVGHFYLGMAYLDLDQVDNAIKAFNNTIRIKPDYAKAYIWSGAAHQMLKKYKESKDLVEKGISIKINGKSPLSDDDLQGAYLFLGEANLNLSNYQEAVSAYKQAIKLNPKNPYAHFGLGKAYISLGDVKSALAEYKILKELDKNKAEELFKQIYK